MPEPRIPVATYRLQLRAGFGFAEVVPLLDLLAELGASDLYLSPITAAKPGSQHGYDVVDYSQVSPELGGENALGALVAGLRARDMGLIVDVVANHMCISGGHNAWWNDVLENGPSSPFAPFFDIDWSPPKADLAGQVLLPVLGDQYGHVLENQEIRVSFEDGALYAHYYDLRLPLTPRSWRHILAPVLDDLRLRLGGDGPHVLELESILTSVGHLPSSNETDPARIQERQREKEVIKRRLLVLAETDPVARAAIDRSLEDLNGRRNDPGSFDRLDALLAAQPYRLSYWRVAADEINFRRFFDINELAAIRVEVPAVFAAVHRLLFDLVARRWVTGLRVDHVDGLYDPERYLRELARGCRQALESTRRRPPPPGPTGITTSGEPALALGGADHPIYTVVEKILMPGEHLHQDWAVDGTTGYDFLNVVGGVFVDTANDAGFRRLYERFTGFSTRFSDLLYESKKLVLGVTMASELHVLAQKLDRISEQHRSTRDFTMNGLKDALREIIACFPVYRSYRCEDLPLAEDDRRQILIATRRAKRRNPAISASVFDFIASVLLGDDPPRLTPDQRKARERFAMQLQQLTGPVTAKGIEDTAFYRFVPLASLNEVGGEPARFGITAERFHARNLERRAAWPNALSSTSTHDTKRGEDARARIHVLSEIPAAWYRAILRWRTLNQAHRQQVEVEGEGVIAEAPDANEEYLFYQTLVGTWPVRSGARHAHADYTGRIEEYMIKALREAKVHTSWINPNDEYERAVREFVRGALRPVPDNRFLRSFLKFSTGIIRAGLLNALGQLVLKIAAPGVPDFYQGAERWVFTLVDPDNRRPPDFEPTRAALDELRRAQGADDGDHPVAKLASEYLDHLEDGRLKLLVTARGLACRARHAELFAGGAYVPLPATGERAANVVGFARTSGSQAVIAVSGRFYTRLGLPRRLPLGAETWPDTALPLPPELATARFRDALTGVSVFPSNGSLLLARVFERLPVALLEKED